MWLLPMNKLFLNEDCSRYQCTLYTVQAISVVSDLVSRGRFDELEGLVTNEVCMSSVCSMFVTRMC